MEKKQYYIPMEVCNAEGMLYNFQINRKVALKYFIDDYCFRKNMDKQDLVFTYEGEVLDEMSTPE